MDAKTPKRHTPPTPPPVGDPDLNKLHEWFRQLREVDAAVTKDAIEIVERHFTGMGLESGEKLKGATDWSGFSLYFYEHAMPVIRARKQRPQMRELFKELIDYTLLNPGGSPSDRLATLLELFLSPLSRETSLVTALLPAGAEPAIELVHAREEDERIRREMSYY